MRRWITGVMVTITVLTSGVAWARGQRQDHRYKGTVVSVGSGTLIVALPATTAATTATTQTFAIPATARISCPGRACTLAELTPSGNQVTAGDGGGVFVYGAYSSIAVRHTTIAGNTATGTGGGMVVRNDVVTVEHTIVADNILTLASTPNDVGTPSTGSFAVSFSLIEAPGTADITDNGGNAPNVDPQLAKLANNGGPTLTHLPANGSPAVNTGNPSIVAPPSTDQRGLTRIVGTAIDMGAVETVVVPVTLQEFMGE